MRHVPPAGLLAVLALAACDTSELPALDAGRDLAVSDAPAPASDKQVSLAVDFALENCPAFDTAGPSCTGKVPLALRFVPLATAPIANYQWDFGDGSRRASEPAPSHVFTSPGEYTVRLIATGAVGGIATQEHSGFVVARANASGEPCEASAQCAPELFCLCPTSAACTGGPPRGMCIAACPEGRCADGHACADLLTAGDGFEPWQTKLCLPRCTDDTDCAAGLRCRLLPPGSTGGWVHGCFSESPRDVGEPCRDSSGVLRNDLCVTGLCLDLGALGMCSRLKCDVESCPPGSDCTLMGDGNKLCLPPCGDSYAFPCDRDPLLTCMTPNPGRLGYQMLSSNSVSEASTYCAPKTCTLPKEGVKDTCAPTGTCTFTDGNHHCIRR